MMKRSKLALFCCCVAVAPLAVGCKRASSAPTETVAAKPPVSVQTEAVTAIEVPRTLRLTGTLRGNREADIAANATGRVLSTAVERGTRVKAGQVLATLDVRAATLSASEARAQAESMGAQEAQARIECERYEKLRAKGAISDLEYQQKITQCRTLPLSTEAARARADLMAQNVGDAVIRAPFAGIVAERYIEVGQYVRQDSRVVTLIAADPMRLELAVPEAEVGNVRPGAEITFAVAAHPGRRFVAEVRHMSGMIRKDTRDLTVEAFVPNAEQLLMPGMFADAELVVGTQSLPSVPKRALVASAEQARAFVVVGGRLEERVLALGAEVSDRVSVRRGVAVGERVVVSELAGLGNGQPVALNAP